MSQYFIIETDPITGDDPIVASRDIFNDAVNLAEEMQARKPHRRYGVRHEDSQRHNFSYLAKLSY